MIIYRCPRGHTRGEADFHKEMIGEPTCSSCIELNWPLCFMERMEVALIERASGKAGNDTAADLHERAVMHRRDLDPIAGHSIPRL